jgi:GNAT superfamily N-acetyltransferase
MEGVVSDLVIRKLREDDRDRLIHMDEEIGGRRRSLLFETRLRRAMRDSDICVSVGAERDGLLVGALMGCVNFGEFGLPEPVAVLDTILVDPSFKSHGIARAMFEQLVDNLHALRVSRLRTEVSWNQLDLIGFFEKMGLVPSRRILLELDLTDPE